MQKPNLQLCLTHVVFYEKALVENVNPGPNGCGGNPFNAMWDAFLDGHRIINMSWSGIGFIDDDDPPTQPIPNTLIDAITEIVGAGTLLVVAAGPDADNGINQMGNWHSAVFFVFY